MADFPWTSARSEQAHGYLLPAVLDVLKRHVPDSRSARLIDLGSGNGSMTAAIAEAGYSIIGVEPSFEGIQQARNHFPNIRFEQGDGYEDLKARFGEFDAIVSCEVVEHLLNPQRFMERVREMMGPEALFLVSTPYHAYLKNVLIALAGKWDFHHHPEREYGHVKFFSRDSLNKVAGAARLREVEFHRVGRIPPLAKSMISVFQTAAS